MWWLSLKCRSIIKMSVLDNDGKRNNEDKVDVRIRISMFTRLAQAIEPVKGPMAPWLQGREAVIHRPAFALSFLK